MRTGIVALLAVVFAASSARAQPAPTGPTAPPAPAAPGPVPPSSPRRPPQPQPRIKLHLDYIRGAGTHCPDEQVVADMLHGEMLYEQDVRAELHLVVEATRQGREHRVFTVMRDATGAALWTRKYQSRDCADALESTMVSTALELLVVEPPQETREARERAARMEPVPPATPMEPVPPATPMEPVPPAPTPSVVAPPGPVVPPPPAAPIPAAPPFALLAGVDLVLGVGSTPSPSFGAGIFVAVRPAHLGLSVELTWRGSATASTSPPGHVAVSTTLYSGQLALCVHRRFVFFCPVAGVGKREYAGLSLEIAPAPPFAIVGARLGAEHRAGHFLFRGFLEFDTLPGAAPAQLYGNDPWRSSFGGAAGIGIAVQP